MSDYYDRLQAQLMQATARPLPRGRRAPMGRWRPSGDLFAVAAALALAVAVAGVFIGLRPSARRVKHPPTQHGLAVVHNYGSRALPPLGGAFSCETRLAPARVSPSRAPTPWNCYLTGTRPAGSMRGSRARGTVIVNVRPAVGDVFSIDASGLPPSTSGGDYAVWLLSGRSPGASCSSDGCPISRYSLIPGRRPAFVGIVAPSVGASGRLRADGLIPALSARQATGSYLFAVTRQARPSNTSLGRVVLQGWLSF